MFEKMKWYVLEVGIKKYAPIGIMAGTAWVVGSMAAHAGALQEYGITAGLWPLHWPAGQEPSGQVILIELDTLSKSVIGLIIASGAMLIRAAQHHTTGNKGIPGGERVDQDPPLETQGESK